MDERSWFKGHVEHRLLSYRFAEYSEESLYRPSISVEPGDVRRFCNGRLVPTGASQAGCRLCFVFNRPNLRAGLWEAVPGQPLIFGPAEDAIEATKRAPLWEGCCRCCTRCLDCDVAEEDADDEDGEDHDDDHETYRRCSDGLGTACLA